ncbi:MAG: TetR family transcriptional regulator C-terminal domain-containing protein, partial [Oscillospiraceae bacterium]|nr:TetR family transcriptional regulator C-terminal domain-containing protein [Oscillospiraceae bacterium]
WQEVNNATHFFGKIFDAIKSNTAEFRLLIQSGTHLNLVEGFRTKIRIVFEDFLSRCEEEDRVVMVYLLDYVCAGVVSVLERWSLECRDDELEQLSKVVGAMIDGTVKNLGNVVSWKTDFLKKPNEN